MQCKGNTLLIVITREWSLFANSYRYPRIRVRLATTIREYSNNRTIRTGLVNKPFFSFCTFSLSVAFIISIVYPPPTKPNFNNKNCFNVYLKPIVLYKQVHLWPPLFPTPPPPPVPTAHAKCDFLFWVQTESFYSSSVFLILLICENNFQQMK